jgi:aminoglycoside phosphotransferase (APT) family kinase protein
MSDTPDLGPVPERISVETAQVRQLIKDQLPQWADLTIEPVADGGWDNWTFHLGDEMVVRLPSATEYAKAVEKEHKWLPVLAPQLPMPIPTPVAKGVPSPAYPHPWSVYRWIEGHPASAERIADHRAFGIDLAAFLSALQAIDPADGPQPGIHNWFRGGALHTYDSNTRRALEDLEGHIDVDAVQEVWTESLGTSWDGVDRWFHGDVAQGNLLLNDAGQLVAVIDFGTCGVGDSACDLAVAWTLLSAEGRYAFREHLAVDDSAWARGRGWALWKTVATCWYTFEDPEDQDEFAQAKRTLDTILREG